MMFLKRRDEDGSRRKAPRIHRIERAPTGEEMEVPDLNSLHLLVHDYTLHGGGITSATDNEEGTTIGLMVMNATVTNFDERDDSGAPVETQCEIYFNEKDLRKLFNFLVGMSLD